MTDASSRQEGCLKCRNTQLSEKKNVVISSIWAPDTKTHWPTDRRSQLNFNFNFGRYSESCDILREVYETCEQRNSIDVERIGECVLAFV
jgi:hypothetical protein